MGPGNGLKGSKSNEPAVENRAVQHRVIENAEFHTIVSQFYPPPILTTCFSTKLIINRSEHFGQTAGTPPPPSYVRVPVLNIGPETRNPDRDVSSLPVKYHHLTLKYATTFSLQAFPMDFESILLKCS